MPKKHKQTVQSAGHTTQSIVRRRRKDSTERKAYRRFCRTQRVNDALYEKMFGQQEQYCGWLCSLPPPEILDNVYEYLVREDILLLLAGRNLAYAQAKALLKLPDPMAAIFDEYAKQGTTRMDSIKKAIQRCADKETGKGCAD